MWEMALNLELSLKRAQECGAKWLNCLNNSVDKFAYFDSADEK